MVRKPALHKPAARPKARGTPPGRNLRLAGVGSEAVERATGKGWDEWLRVLDRAGAKTMTHKEIAPAA